MNHAALPREDTRLRFLKVDTSNVADVLDDMDLPNQGLAADFKPYPASAGKLAGWAYTIRGQMAPYPGKGDPDKMKACQGLAPGDVTVWSGDGEGICYFGELIAVGMKERGSVGALVDGGVEIKLALPPVRFFQAPSAWLAQEMWSIGGGPFQTYRKVPLSRYARRGV